MTTPFNLDVGKQANLSTEFASTLRQLDGICGQLPVLQTRLKAALWGDGPRLLHPSVDRLIQRFDYTNQLFRSIGDNVTNSADFAVKAQFETSTTADEFAAAINASLND